MTGRASRKAADTPTGTVTFLFTDIEGSTALHENYPDLMYAALKRHDDILRRGIEANGGYVFSTGGDAFCAAFTTARQALQAALAAQRALFAEGWPENVEVRVRMGLHTGVPEERDGNYFGPPLNRVARLMSAGHGGQVLLSDATYNLVRDHLVHLEPGSELRDLGEHRLRDLRYTEHIFQLVVPDLPEGFEPLKTHGLVTPSEITDLDRRYGRARHIGGGGFGEVFLVHHEALDRDMALKVLARQYANDEQFVKLFKREARSAAKLSHPNIVAVYDAGEGIFEGRKVSYIAMEYVPGGTLKDLIRGQGEPLPLRTAIELALQVAGALRAAHRGELIHRDIKPQNVLLTEGGEAKVADFGIARAVAASTTFTRTTDGMLGTPHYISPEQVLGEPANFRSDLYSLGVVLYEMLTGTLPYDAETPVGIVMKHVNGHLRLPTEVNPEIPEGLNAICIRLLAKDPEERYPDADALIADLEWARDEPDTVVDDTGPTIPDPERATDDLDAIKGDTKPTTVRIPDLTGQSLARTPSMLAEASLSLGSQSQAPSDTVPEGEIIRQYPSAGTEVEAYSSVSVTVSTGPSTVEVPDLRSQNVSRANSTLAAAGLKLGAQEKVPSDTIPGGGIVRQNPEAGTEVEAGSPVSVTVSSGPEEATTVPGLSDSSTEEAERASSNAGPVLVSSRTEENRRVGPEDSSKQTARGATVRVGKRAKLWIGMGLLCAVVAVGLIAALAYSLTGEDATEEVEPTTKEAEPETADLVPEPAPPTPEAATSESTAPAATEMTVKVPDLYWYPEAKADLANEGLKLGFQHGAPSDTTPSNVVIRSNPAEGAEVEQGTTVDIYVSTGSDGPGASMPHRWTVGCPKQ